MKILVTGAAGFIGFHLSKRLLEDGYEVIGYDNMNSYYDVNLKNARLEILKREGSFTFIKGDLEDKELLDSAFSENEPEYVVNLAAQAGVRYSLENPRAYIDSNIIGFLNILEACRNYKVKHLVFASSSSVYGGNMKLPFSTSDSVDHPISLYAATKKSNELMAHTYSHLYHIPVTGLRFFTVYGPYGRPDMALFLFAKAIFSGEPVKVFNNGKMARDFTYIDDIVEGIVRVMKRIPEADPNAEINCDAGSSAFAPYKVYNIGNNNPVELEHLFQLSNERSEREQSENTFPCKRGMSLKPMQMLRT
jgi:UDP-glucuronate 4-epimerase